jgi:AcrR family transcriptional regulator
VEQQAQTRTKRKYKSAKRREQAEATRRRVVASARRLFAEHGYTATTIEAIAGDAGVAVQTIYAAYGSKRGILLATLNELEVQADLPELMKALQEAKSDPLRQLQHVVAFNVKLFERAADILEMLRAAGSADADLAAMSREGEERRRAGQAPIVRAWTERGSLRSGLKESEAADILWALTGPDNYRLFVIEQGWSADRYRDWLEFALESLLFDG